MVTSGGAVKLTGNQAVKVPLGKANGLARIHVNKKTFITSPEENAERISSFIFMGMELSLDVDKIVKSTRWKGEADYPTCPMRSRFYLHHPLKRGCCQK